MKKILFDGIATQGTSRSMFHGGAEYAKFILREAIGRRYSFDVVLDKSYYTDPEIEELLLEWGKEHRVIEVRGKRELFTTIEQGGYNTFYSALPYGYHDYKGSAHLIGVIHGLRSVELVTDEYRYKYEKGWLRSLAHYGVAHLPYLQGWLRERHQRHYRRILEMPNITYITVSNHSKYALLNFYPLLKPEQVKVFYSPFSVEKYDPCTEHGDYFLLVSGGRFEKNVYRAVLAFDKLFTDGRLSGRNVTVTGCGNQRFWKEIKNKDRFCLLPYVSTEELERLYREAFCFVYPSLNEGFCYPPVKAMAYGVPVIASSATSIPEVCGNAACYFSPTSVDDLCNRILRIDQDKEYREDLIFFGLEWCKKLQLRQSQELEEELKMIFE